ncbi:MAG: tail fiber domain-containing protein [Pyrinomonadaceae bacterium]
MVLAKMPRLTLKLIFLCATFSVALYPALAQQKEKPAPGADAERRAVVATVTPERLRVVAPGAVVETRLEVYSAAGELLFDSAAQPGNTLDWAWRDAQGQPLADGTYLCIVTTRQLGGRLTRSRGQLTVQGQQPALRAAGQLAPAQVGATEAGRELSAEDDGPLTVIAEGVAPALIVTAHDGRVGQVTSTTGALTFRTGDLFTGQEREVMRLTADGRVGVGTSKPEAMLDVAGTLRARGGIVFDDGTALTSAGRAARAASDGAVEPLASGTGTANRLAKWADAAGTLADSNVTEAGGNVGIGTTSPASLLHLAGPAGVNAITLNTPGSHRFRFQTVAGVPNWGALTLNSIYNSGWQLDDTSTNGWFFKLDTRGGNAANPENGLWLYRIPAGPNPHTDELPMFGVTHGRAYFAGNVGIGTQSPQAALDVAGSLKLTGAGSGITFADGTTQTTAGAGGGGVSGSGTANTVPLWTGTSSLANSVITQSGGNIGVGTTAPTSALHVVGASQPTVATGIGADAPSVLQVVGGNGGSTNDYAPSYGGNGADVLIQAGNGGTGFNGGGAGHGGSITLRPGSHGGQAGGPNVHSSGDLLLAPSDGGQYGENVLIGPTDTADPNHYYSKLHVAGNAFELLRVAKSAAGGHAASFGSNGDFLIDAAGVDGGRFIVQQGGNVGVGTASPAAKLDVAGDARVASNLTVDTSTLVVNATSDRVGVGTASAPTNKLQVFDSSNTGLRVENNTAGGTIASFGSNGDFQVDSPFIPGGRLVVKESGNVGVGQTSPTAKLDVNGNIKVATLGTAGSTTLCRNAANEIATCSSSLRYKENVAPFRPGLDLLSRLRPVAFDWKDSGQRDLGFVAEEVGRVEPLLVTRNAAGEVEGVKYDRISAVLVNAVREQQQQLAAQRRQLAAKDAQLTRQGAQLTALEARLAAVEHRINSQARLHTTARARRRQRARG